MGTILMDKLMVEGTLFLVIDYKVVCCRYLLFSIEANSVYPDQNARIGAV